MLGNKMNIGKRAQQMMRMIRTAGRKNRNNRWMLPIVGLGLGATAYAMVRNQNVPIQQMLGQLRSSNES